MEDQGKSAQQTILRRFEPIIRYTRGERFFPIDVERYIRQCSLWVQRPDEPAEVLIPQGEMTVQRLIEPREDEFGTIYYLKFIEPLDLLELARFSVEQAVQSLQHRVSQDGFRMGRGRLARVGYSSRLVDALFSISLFMRGRVPGDTAAAAALTYRRMLEKDSSYQYYGRVFRENGWVVLQYWYFYPFNNWRSGFFGVNDHEGDWEMVSIYCYEADDPSQPPECRLHPQWVAYASHDFSGDDLRRRWDDPELEKAGDHPIVYAGAGSHASYYRRGEYQAELELQFMRPAALLLEKIQTIWVNWLRQAGSEASQSELQIFRVPFVDYARGDGVSIGPGQDHSWQIGTLDESTAWATRYRGLWGLYARDPISGENAPAGPVYNRDGSVRRSWYDPLGWAGLDKVAPPDEALAILYEQRKLAQSRRDELEAQIREKSAILMGLGIQHDALVGSPYLEGLHEETVEQIQALSDTVNDLRRQYTQEQDRLAMFDQHVRRLQNGELGPMRAHIHRAHEPNPELNLRLGRLAEVFAASSIGLSLIGLVLLFLFARQYVLLGLALMIGLIIFVEAGFRRRLSQLVTSLVIGLAVVTALILLFEFFWQVLIALVLITGIYILWDNIRELRYLGGHVERK